MIDTINNLQPATLEVAGLVVGLTITVAGWAYSTHRQRVLLRRQQAVDLLSKNRFQPELVAAERAVWGKIVTEPQFDWAKLMADRNAGGLDDDDMQFYQQTLTVLNHLEFLAIAVLNKAADEHLIRWSQEYFFKTANTKMLGFIEQARTDRNDDCIFCNLTDLAKRWKKKPEIARPTDGFFARSRSKKNQ